MAKWNVRSVSQMARVSGSTTVTHNFTAASVNSLLVACVGGSTTHTTPTGWTLVNSAVNLGGVYVFRKIATAGESTFSTTANAANYPSTAVIYEFGSGSTVGTSAQKTVAGTTTFTGAALAGLGASAKLIIGVGNQDVSSTTNVPAWSAWSSSAVEDTDTGFVQASGTSGHGFGIAYLEDSVLTSWTPTATVTNPGVSGEGVTFSVNVVGGVAPPALPIIVLAPRR